MAISRTKAKGIRAGLAFVELYVHDKATAALRAVETRFRKIGASMREMGTFLAKVAGSFAIPFVASIKSFATFDDAMAQLQATANPTAAKLAQVREEIMELSKETGIAPSEIAASFTELLKAGLSLEKVMAGAGKATIYFSRVGGVAAAEAAVLMADAMNVFAKDGKSAIEVVNTLSQAADASSISLDQVRESFGQSAAAFGLAGQNLRSLAIAIGIMGNAGIKGSDAGTSLRTMMLRLGGSVAESSEGLAAIGLVTRKTSGEMEDLETIVGRLSDAVKGMNQEARDKALYKIGGADAIRALATFARLGKEGFADFGKRMEAMLPIADKFKIVISSLGNQFRVLLATAQRVGIVIGTALEGPLKIIVKWFKLAADWVEMFAKKNPELVQWLAASAAALAALAVTLVIVGYAFTGIGMAFGVFAGTWQVMSGLFIKFLTIIASLFSPLGLLVVALGAVTAAVLYFSGAGSAALKMLGQAWEWLSEIVGDVIEGMVAALSVGDIVAAAKVLWAGLVVVWTSGKTLILGIWNRLLYSLQTTFMSWVLWFSEAWAGIWFDAETVFTTAILGVKMIWKELVTFYHKSMNMIGDYITSIIGAAFANWSLWIAGLQKDIQTLSLSTLAFFKIISEAERAQKQMVVEEAFAGKAREAFSTQSKAEEAKRRLAKKAEEEATEQRGKDIEGLVDALAEIEKRRAASEEAAAEYRARTFGDLDERFIAEQERLNAELIAAEEELKKAIEAAKKVAQPKPIEGAWGQIGALRQAERFGEMAGGPGVGQDLAARTAAGTFNPFEAIRMGGARTPEERTAKGVEAIQADMKLLAQAMRQRVLVWGN